MSAAERAVWRPTAETLAKFGIVDDDATPESEGNLAGFQPRNSGRFDIDSFIRSNLNVKNVDQWNGSTKYILTHCPFDESHKAPDAAVFVGGDGKIGFRCLHNSCANYRWQDVRKLYEPDAYTRQNDKHNHTPHANVPKQRAPSLRELMRSHPEMRPPVIHGLLRRGETMNIIAPPKMGKSWLVTSLAIQATCGGRWLDTFGVTPSKVLVLDNELHPETSASRIPRVAQALGVLGETYLDSLFIENLRGKSLDVFTLRHYLDQYQPGELGIVIIDAFYRALPKGVDENANGDITSVYNAIDEYAARLDCSFVLIHHASKGNQAGKAVTDVGSGAGSQSRATDTHVVLREHEEPGVVVLDAAVRSWAPIEPICLRWEWPLFHRADDLDPTQLFTGRPRKEATAKQSEKTNKFDEQCRAALQHFAAPLTLSGLKRAMNISGNTAKEIITALVESSEIIPAKVGVYDGYEIAKESGGTTRTEN